MRDFLMRKQKNTVFLGHKTTNPQIEDCHTIVRSRIKPLSERHAKVSESFCPPFLVTQFSIVFVTEQDIEQQFKTQEKTFEIIIFKSQVLYA